MTGPRFYDHSDKPHYVYRCFDADDRLVYVGCTVSPVNRLETHRASTWWFHHVARVRFVVFPDRAYALSKEREAIATENPRFNTKGRWAHRALWTEDDYRDYFTAIVMSGNSGTAYLATHLKKVALEAQYRYGLTLSERAA